MIDLDALARAAAHLEPLPASVTRLAALVAGGTPEIDEVVETVAFDQSLTVSLLRTANSSWSAARSPITTVRDAVVRLGTGPVLSLALGVNVKGAMAGAVPEYGLAEGELWAHSVAASLAAELLIRASPVRPPAEVATAALLHDVGKLVMARFLDDDVLASLRRTAIDGGTTRIEAERELLGVDHAEFGGLIAQTWGLPEGLVRGITFHHAPGVDGSAAAYCVFLADVVAKVIGVGADDNPDLESYAHAMEELQLGPARFEEVCRLADERFVEVSERYG